jgi:hypothetical protein
MKTLVIVSIAACLLGLSTPAYAAEPLGPKLALLHAAAPGAVWNTKLVETADVNCDGVKDTLIAGTLGKEKIVVGVIPGDRSQASSSPLISTFYLGKHTQDSFCGTPVRIDIYSIMCSDEEFGDLPGCKPVKGCSAFSVDDAMCDSFNFYWNTPEAHLSWWRR